MKRMLLPLIGSCVLGCTAAAVPPAWYDSPPKCDGCYQGVGRGSNYEEAKWNAMAHLCESIRVVVTSEWKSEEAHRLQETTREGLQSARVDFTQAVSSIARMTAKCHFEGLPIKEDPQPVRSGDAVFVRLVLSAQDYARYLSQRAAALVLDTGDTSLAPDQARFLENAAVDYLLELGYLPTTAKAGETPFKLVVAVIVSVSETGVQGLKVASTTPSLRLEETDTGRIVWQKTFEPITLHGFEEADLRSHAIAQASAAIRAAIRGDKP